MTEGPDRLEPGNDERPDAATNLIMLKPGDRAPDVTVRDETGADVRLRDLWAAAPRGLALVFVRHFGCAFSRAHAVVLREARARFDEEGVRVAVVGMGTPAACARFRRRYDLPFPVLSDPDRAAYRAYGLAEGTRKQVMGWPEIGGRVRLALRGYLPGLTGWLDRQLAGDFLIDRDGVLRYVRRSRRAADIPPPAALLAAAHELL